MVGYVYLFFVLIYWVPPSHSSSSNFYSLTAESVSGDTVSLDQFKGKVGLVESIVSAVSAGLQFQVSLVVNVASKCGYTDLNYKELVKLQQKYGDRGFTVLAFPSNQFGQQEPGTNQQILSFASDNYEINFPIFSKVDVMGDSQCDVYRHLTETLGSEPSWNFCKYLVDRNGEVLQFFSVEDNFTSIETSVEYLLSTKHSEL